MPGISEEDKHLNDQLEEAINRAIIDEEYGEIKDLIAKIKGLIANGKLLPISNKIYDLLFFDGYPMSPKLPLMMENDNLQDVVSFFIQRVPKDFLCAAEPKNSVNNTPLITFIFHHRQDLIPNLLEVISESGRNDITFGLSGCFPKTHQTRETIEKYCTKNEDGSYKVVPDPSAIKGKSQELQQCFKDIVIAINSRNFDEVKNIFGKVKDILDKVESADTINVDSMNETLCMLVKETKPSEEIALTIVKFQRDMTSTMLENVDATSPSGSIENTSATPPSGSIENTSATSPSGSIGRE